MAYTSPVHVFSAIIALLLTSALPAVSSTSQSPAAARAEGCSAELVAFSPCLPYVSSPPNNIASSPSSDCCGVFSSAFETGVANCLCYIVRRSMLFGFPLNSTRLTSLSSLCPLQNAGPSANGSLESLCSAGLSELPPQQGIIGSGIPKAHDSGPDSSSAPAMSSLMPDSDVISAATPSPSTTTSTHYHAIISSASNQINSGCWASLTFIALFVPILTILYCHTTHR